MSEPREWTQVAFPYNADTFDYALNAGRMKCYMLGTPLARAPKDISDVELVSVTTRVVRGESEGTLLWRLRE